MQTCLFWRGGREVLLKTIYSVRISTYLYLYLYAYHVSKLQTDVMIWILKESSGRHSSLMLYSHLKDLTAYFNADLFYSLLYRELLISTNHYWT